MSQNDGEMSTFKMVLLSICALFGLLIIMGFIGFVAQGYDFFMFKIFAPKYEQARRETFEQSKAYNDGMAQELRAMQMDYIKADEPHKKALKSVILHRISGYPEDHLPSDLQAFVNELKGSDHAY